MPPLKKTTIALNAYYLPKTFVIEEATHHHDSPVTDWVKAFNDDKYQALYHLGFLDPQPWFTPSVEFLYRIAEELIKQLTQDSTIELMREQVQLPLTDELLTSIQAKLPFVIGMEYVDNDWIVLLWSALLQVFKQEIQVYDGTVSQYFAHHNANLNVVGRVYFHLVENKTDELPFAFMASYSTKPTTSQRAIHLPLKHALQEFAGDEKQLLALISSVVKASVRSQLIADLLDSGELFHPIKFTVDEAFTFLKELEIYEAAGIMCRIPNWWRKRSKQFQVSISIGEQAPSEVGLAALMDFNPTLHIGDATITEQELRDLLLLAEGLIMFKGQWIEVNTNQLLEALVAFTKIKHLTNSNHLSVQDALRLELNVDQIISDFAPTMDVSITNGQWLKTTKDGLINPTKLAPVPLTTSLNATLRHYQSEGYQWLHQMANLGFGACLADDMGLGKTVQIIAFLEYLRVNRSCQVLLILPASLIGNWQKEIEKFAPAMTYYILHASSNKSLDLPANQFLFITTYGMATRLASLNEQQWDYLIIDEAQAIKNPNTKQTKAIKSIKAHHRIALTGTPIENRLSDLWSLFDFLNQGLLGTPKEFSTFSNALKDHPQGYAKLRRIIQPFILRRLKTDKQIISDLPDKIEMPTYPILTKTQAILYQQLLDQIVDQLTITEGIARKGLILASIMKFKQLCNHPDQYLGLSEYKPETSGKFQQLREICETINEKHERVIIFTQFKEMTQPIADFLAGVFDQPGLVLHGGTPIKQRQSLVEQFNGEHYVPFMVLSLKAGGVGLNLTAANHVIHFDRWWNPAVENQATDRAFRIGQTKNVMVHKFVTKGTIEEKIDKIINDKLQLSSELIVSTGEQWITQYSNEELMAIFALEGD